MWFDKTKEVSQLAGLLFSMSAAEFLNPSSSMTSISFYRIAKFKYNVIRIKHKTVLPGFLVPGRSRTLWLASPTLSCRCWSAGAAWWRSPRPRLFGQNRFLSSWVRRVADRRIFHAMRSSCRCRRYRTPLGLCQSQGRRYESFGWKKSHSLHSKC